MPRDFVLEDAPPSASLAFADELNDEQHAVVSAGGGPLLVIAGAGSGKTRALTYRVAHLIDRGTRPDRILLLTFTNRAASEMLTRVRGLAGNAARGVWGGTFHSVGRRVLSRYADRLGYGERFGIMDRDDAQALMKQCIADVVPNTTDVRFPRAGLLVNVLSQAANTSRSAVELFRSRYPRFDAHANAVERVWVAYQGKKFEYGLMDFDDLLVNWRRLVLEHDDVRQELAGRFEHVLVDEYQDTNAIQAELVDLMSSVHGNLTVVGDDCQSIYSFRGAEFTNILEFPERHPGTQVFRLETNYRSTPEILALANASIGFNKRQFAKTLLPVRAPGLAAGHVRCANEDEQSRFVAQRILQLRDEGVELDRVSILYRAHWQSMELQIELGRRNIPFRVHSGQRFFEQRHVKDLLAFLRFANNPKDDLAFQRIACLADGIGPKTAQRVLAHMRTFATIEDGLRSPDTAARAGRRALRSWPRLVDVLLALRSPSCQDDAAAAMRAVLDGFYEDFALHAFDNGDNRVRDLDALAELGARYDDTDEFLQTMALAGEVSGVDQLNHEESDEAVVLSSIHQAKGLEFHTVFVLWLSEDRFPSPRAEDDELEEERRLFYVAVTRAEQELYLTTPISAWERGVGLVTLRDSLFVRELERVRPPVIERINLVRG